MQAKTLSLVSEASWLRLRRRVTQFLGYSMLIFLSFVFMIPFIWLVSSSFKTPWDAVAYPPQLLPDPTKVTWYNFELLSLHFPFLRGLINTMYIVVGVEVGRLLSASLVAYSFARLRFRFKTPIFLAVLSTMMLPYHVTLVPQYLIFREFGWIDTYYPLIVPAWLGGGAFYVFLLRQFFQTIPLEYDDSARMDGAGVLQIFWYIILPLSLPALGVVAIFTFMGEWNDFFAPVIYINDNEKKPLAVALYDWQRSGHLAGALKQHPWSAIMAASMLVTLPPIIVFFFAQRYFIQGIVISGVKG